MREMLTRFGILSYRLFYFERRSDGSLIPPSEYPHQALVSSTTHDLPTLAGYWSGRDIEARERAGLLPNDGTAARMRAERVRDKQHMLDALHLHALLPLTAGKPMCCRLTGELLRHYRVSPLTPSADDESD
jgi:4-alpha-glucanotransferase